MPNGSSANRIALPPRTKTSVAQSPTLKEYTVAWISTLSIELASAMVMLDTVFDTPIDFIRSSNDSNVYYYGSIRKHNVVVAGLPADSHYTVAAATTTQLLMTAFPNIRFTLLVGIGGAIPKLPDHDVRLGDIVIGGKGVFQHDHGKSEQNNTWISKSPLVKPPDILGKALNMLLARHEQAKASYLQILQAAMDDHQKWGESYKYPAGATDRLFHSDYNHTGNPRDCSECSHEREHKRVQRKSANPHVHNGVIASGNSVVKDSIVRDTIGSQSNDCICLEMEAGGLMGNSQFLVIRGICDYSDSHKNNSWQRYAAATAAAVAKELLKWVPPVGPVNGLAGHIAEQNPNPQEAPETQFLKSLDGCEYEKQKDEHCEAQPGTCGWFTNNLKANDWWSSSHPYEFLWLTLGESGGKSVLTRHLVDIVLRDTLCYFFFKPGIGQRGSMNAAMQSILHQLFTQKPTVLRTLFAKYDLQQHISENGGSFSKLWSLFLSVLEQNDVGRVTCLFDAFDDFRGEDRQEFLDKLRELHDEKIGENTRIKIIITSRSTENMRFAIHSIESRLNNQHKEHSRHIFGDEEAVFRLIEKEVKLVIGSRLDTIRDTYGLSSMQRNVVLDQLDRLPKSTYLWVNRALALIEADQVRQGRHSIEGLSRTIDRWFANALSNKSFDGSIRMTEPQEIVPLTHEHTRWD